MPRRLLLTSLIALAAVIGSPDAAGQDFAPSHLQAADELLIASGTKEAMAQAQHEMIRVQIEHNPALAPFEDVMRGFLAEYTSWEALRGEMARLYASRFTEEELREITAFHQSPVGRKAVTLMPELMAEGMGLGERRVQENTDELVRRLEERVAELGGGG